MFINMLVNLTLVGINPINFEIEWRRNDWTHFLKFSVRKPIQGNDWFVFCKHWLLLYFMPTCSWFISYVRIIFYCCVHIFVFILVVHQDSMSWILLVKIKVWWMEKNIRLEKQALMLFNYTLNTKVMKKKTILPNIVFLCFLILIVYLEC